MERLDKIISATGKKSRREVREMVRQGRVLVDGKPAPAADMKVDPQTAVILLDGEPLGYEKFTYVMLHKPAGVLTATEDRRQEKHLIKWHAQSGWDIREDQKLKKFPMKEIRRQFPFRGQRLQMGYMISVSVD